MTFANKEYFLLLLLLIPYLVWFVRLQKTHEPLLRISDSHSLSRSARGARARLRHLPLLFRILALVFIVIVLARPQTSFSWNKKHVEGIDIMLAIDVSTSMLAQDLRPNRLEAAKKVATTFINDRPTDNIGLTIFAGEAFTQCPMTLDHQVLLNSFHAIRADIAQQVIEDGTAIGMGLANAVSRLKESKAKSRIIILLTDGSNNTGDLSPLTVAQMAKSFGIRVYTIGVGTDKVAPYPMMVAGSVHYVNMPVEIDTETLKKIAAMTGGSFYRATNVAELQQIYKDIDKLEKTKFNKTSFSKRYEAYLPFAVIALILLLLELILRLKVFQRVP